MARIKIKDLPKDMKISKEEMKMVMGGFNPQPEPPDTLSQIPLVAQTVTKGSLLWGTFGGSTRYFIK